MKWVVTIIMTVLLAPFGKLFAETHEHAHEQALPTPSNFHFIENKAQWPDQVHYKVELPGGSLFLEDLHLTYDFFDHENLHNRLFHPTPEQIRQPKKLDHHAFRVHFRGANIVPLKPEKVKSEYRNYYLGNDPTKWASGVKSYEQVTYEGIYSGIDLKFYTLPEGLKYDFVVEAGRDPGVIEMEYEGVSKLRLREGALQIKTSVNEMWEAAPVAWQWVNGEKKEVPCHFVLEKNSVRFAFPEGWDNNRELIIDPTLVFSTYTGSASDNWGFTATYDEFGNHYAGGIVFGNGYPVNIGSYQTTFGAGSNDVSISKFSDDGTALLWATYLGGSGADQPHSLIVNDNNELVIFGRTESQNFPVLQTSYDPTLNGDWDMFLAKLSGDGRNLTGSTYIGGLGADGVNMTASAFTQITLKYNYGDDARGEVVTDKNNNIYVASCTQSSNFPVTATAYQRTYAGNQDGCVFKFDPDLTTLTWSTYLGGAGNDACYSIDLGDGDVPYVTGGTASQTFPSTTGARWSSLQGNIDGFISRLSADGSSLTASTFIGTSAYDQCYFVKLDRDGAAYVVGQTEGNFPVTPGVYSNPNSGQFIMKLTPDLTTTLYSTRFGSGSGIPDISPTAFMVDVCRYVYVSGWGGPRVNFGGTITNMPVTSDAYRPNTDGNDLYIIVLQDSGSALEYATYFGGNQSAEHVDGGTSRFNKRAVIYQSVCAGCGGNDDFPYTTGAYTSNNASLNCNLGAFKMEFTLPGIAADFNILPGPTGCAPLDLDFNNNSSGGVNFYWNFGDGSPIATTYDANHVYTSPGFYTVTLVAVDSASCNIADTARRIIQVQPAPNVVTDGDTTLCPGEPAPLFASGAQAYSWSPANLVSNPTSANPSATVDSTTTFWVYGTNTFGCVDSASVTITTHPEPQANGGPDGLICPDSSVQLQGSGGFVYSWSPGAGLSCTNCPNPVASPLVTTNYVLTITDFNGCTDEDTVVVRVSPAQAQAGPDLHFCAGEDTILVGQGGIIYQWDPPFGLSNPNISNPQVSFPNDTSITYSLLITTPLGCQDYDTVTVTRHPLPIAEAGPDTIVCLYDSIQLNATGGVSYQWTPPAGLSNPNVGNPFVSPSALTTYYVTVTDQWGCSEWDSLSVDVKPIPTAVASGDVVICEDSLTQLNASGGVYYQWRPPLGLSSTNIPDPFANPTTTTDYIVTAIAANNCTDEDTVRVEVTPTPVVDAGPDIFICQGFTAELSASGTQTYEWNTGATTPSFTVFPQDTTTYWVVGYVDGCPSLPDSVNVNVDQELPVANMLPVPDSGWIALDVHFLNGSWGANSYQWDFGDGNGSSLRDPKHTYQDTGHFPVELIVTSPRGCQDTAYGEVIVEASFTLFAPSGFTPNGDGTNDLYTVGWTGVKEFEIRIYSRWGILLYRSTDPNFGWDGTYQGRPCPEGVYTFVIDGKGYLGEQKQRAGTITLVR